MAQRYGWDSSTEGDASVVLQRHDTAEDLLCEMWSCDVDDLKKSTLGGFDGDGKEYELPFDEVIDNIKKMGCYGFADAKKIIHFWVDTDIVDPADFIGMMAHEKGHLIRPFYRDEMKEEMKADKYGDAAAFAFGIYRDVFNDKAD